MLPYDVPLCGLEAYGRGVTIANLFFGENGKKLRKYIHVWKVKAIYLTLI